MSHEPRLPCPACGYDLVGLFRDDSTARCPECGGTANLEAVRVELDRRAAWWHVPAGFLAIFCVLLLVSPTRSIGFAEFEAIDLVFVGAFAGMAYVTALFWLDLRQAERLLFVAGVMVIATLAGGALLAIWFLTFSLFSFLRRWRQIGDRF